MSIKFTIRIELLNIALKVQSFGGVLGSQGMAAGIYFGDSFYKTRYSFGFPAISELLLGIIVITFFFLT